MLWLRLQHADLEMHEVEQQLLQIKRRLQPPPAVSEGAATRSAVDTVITFACKQAMYTPADQRLVVAAAVWVLAATHGLGCSAPSADGGPRLTAITLLS